MKTFCSLPIKAAFLTLFLCACGVPTSPGDEAEQASSDEAAVSPEVMAWENWAHRDLFTGDIQFREDVQNFVIPAERFDEFVHHGDGTFYLSGDLARELQAAKRADIVWFGDELARSVVSTEPTEHGLKVETVRFWLFEYVWGDFEFDLGELYTRGRFADLGLWTEEHGYLIPRETLVAMEWPEVQQLSQTARLPELGDLINARVATASGPTVTLAHPEAKYTDPNTGESIELKVTGELKFPLTVEGIIKLRVVRCSGGFQACRSDSNWVQRKTSITRSVDSESSDGEYERCVNDGPDGPAITTCLDQLLVKFEPGLDPSVKAEVIAKMDRLFSWKVGEDDDNTEIWDLPIPDILLGPYVKLKPSIFVDAIGSVGVGTEITLTGEIEGQMRVPMGVEIFGSEQAALRTCGGCVGNPRTCGCTSGLNTIPNDRHPLSASITRSADVDVQIGNITAKAGVAAGVKLGVAPSIGLVVIDGIKAGVKLVGDAEYSALRVGTAASEDACLKLEAKLIPFGSFDASVKLDVGDGVELFSLGDAEVEFMEVSLGKYENSSVCADATPRNTVALEVIGDVSLGGVNDMPGFEVDSVFLERAGEIFYANGEQAPDGWCDATNWTNVDDFMGSMTYTFSENFQPGDVIWVVRLTEKRGVCNPSGTARASIGPNEVSSTIGNQDLSWSHVITQADLR